MDLTASRLSGRIVDAGIVRRPIPLRRPLRGANGPVTTRSIRLLQLKADDGCAGIGEASGVDWLPASPVANVAPLFRMLVERIRADAPAAETLLRWSMDPERPSAVRAALQTALLDVEARRLGCSVAALLGAAEGTTAIDLSALVGDDDPEAMAREAAALAARGLKSFKVKVGGPDLALDLARVAAVRGAIGSAARLRLDANAAWHLDDARHAVAALEGAGAEFLEEPLRDSAESALLGSPVRIALDESVSDHPALERALARGGFDVLVLKLERVGGPLPALAMAQTAMRAGIEVVFTDSIESVVGRAATAHVAAAAYARGGVAASAVGLGGLFLLDEGADADGAATGSTAVHGPGLGMDLERASGARQR